MSETAAMRPMPQVARWSAPAICAGVAALALLAWAPAASAGHTVPVPDPADWVSVDNGVLKVTVKAGTTQPGSWKAEYSDNAAVWPHLYTGAPFVGRLGAGASQEFPSEFRILMVDSGNIYSIEPERAGSTDLSSPAYHQGTTTGSDIAARRWWVESSYRVGAPQTTAEAFTVTQRITLADQGTGPNQKATTFVTPSWRICNTHTDPMRYGFGALIDSVTPGKLNSYYRYLDAATQPVGSLATDAHGTVDPASAVYTGIHLADDTGGDPEFDWFGMVSDWQIPVKDPVTPPAVFYHASLDALEDEFVAPPSGGTSTSTDVAAAWYWGWKANNPTVLVLPSGACHDLRTHIALEKDAILKAPPATVDPVPVPTIQLLHHGTTCQDSQVKLSAYASKAAAGAAPARIRWTILKDGSPFEVHPVPPAPETWTDANINITRTFADPGTYTFQLRLWNSKDETAIASTELVSVGDPNCPPVVTPPPPLVATVGSFVTYQLQYSDYENKPLTFKASGMPANAKLDTRSGYFQWQVLGGYCSEPPVTSYPITITVSDNINNVAVELLVNVVCDATQVAAMDRDGDGVQDGVDNCYLVPNRDQNDSDLDGVGDACDEAVTQIMVGDEQFFGRVDASPHLRCDVRTQGDLDGDMVADPCDPDIDGDDVPQRAAVAGAFVDNCPFVPNANQRDSDGDGIGDACDGTDGAGFATLGQELAAGSCEGCIAKQDPVKVGGAPTRFATSDLGMVAMGVTLAVLAAAGVIGFIALRRRG